MCMKQVVLVCGVQLLSSIKITDATCSKTFSTPLTLLQCHYHHHHSQKGQFHPAAFSACDVPCALNVVGVDVREVGTVDGP